MWHFVPDNQCGILLSLALLLGIFGSMSLHNRLCLRFTTYVTASRPAWCDQSRPWKGAPSGARSLKTEQRASTPRPVWDVGVMVKERNTDLSNASIGVSRSEARDQEPVHPRDGGNLQVSSGFIPRDAARRQAFVMESLILAQDERWRRA